MKNYVAPAEVVDFTVAGTAILSGAGRKIGDAFLVATKDGAVGEVIAGLRLGMVELAKVSAQAWTEGQQINFDTAAGLATTVTTGNFRIGYAGKVAANPSSTGWVVLHGGNLGSALA